jgi:predicted PurR-regulated permease PerM
MELSSATSAPSTKLTAAGIAAVIVSVVGRWLESRYGFIPDPWMVDIAVIVIAAGVGYLAPELAPSRSAEVTLQRREAAQL